MKKIILTVLALTISVGAFAQINWGVKTGVNISNIRDTDYGAKPSIYAGAFAEMQFNYFLTFQAELIYSRQGGYDKVNGTKMWARLNYLNIPVIAKFNVWKKLTLDTGPQFGFMLNSKLKTKSGGTTVKRSIHDTKTFEFAWAFGATYRLTEKIDLSARYNLGLSKVVKHTDDKPKNGVFQIGAGYRF